jgi:hypothetical protein
LVHIKQKKNGVSIDVLEGLEEFSKIIKDLLQIQKEMEKLGYEEAAEDVLKSRCKMMKKEMKDLKATKDEKIRKMIIDMGRNGLSDENVKLATEARSQEIDEAINELKKQFDEMGCA